MGKVLPVLYATVMQVSGTVQNIYLLVC